MQRNLKNSLAFVIGAAVIIAAWYATASAINDELFVPSPSEVVRETVAILSEKSTYKSIIGTFWRSTISFLISFVAAIAFASVASLSSYAEKAFYPLVAIVRVTPAMSIIFLCLIWLKAESSPVAISFIVVFPMLYSATLNALKNRDKKITEMLKVFGVSPAKRFFGVTLPDVFNRLFPELISTLAFSVKLTVSGEALAYTKASIGREMYRASSLLITGRVIAWTILAILLSVIIELAAKLVYNLIRRGIRENGRKKSV